MGCQVFAEPYLSLREAFGALEFNLTYLPSYYMLIYLCGAWAVST